MPDYTQQPLVNKHSNNGLFSDYYLDELLPKQWDAQLFTAGRRVLEQIKALRGTVQPETLDEAQLEDRWIQPILKLLGHHYAVQGKIRYREKGYRKPDYAFLANEHDAHAVTNKIYTPQEITHWLAVGDAKVWGAKLDQSTKEERSPSQQIDEYLRYSERPWGILTDGRYWRLYHRETSKYNTYYAIDLDSLIESDSGDAFLYFYAFFCLEAFTDGWLARVLASSEEFAQKLTDTLEDEVYDALEMIAQGALDYRRNRLAPDKTTLQDIYQHSLILLYRLLFIFYAESREILPLHQNSQYTDHRSLKAIKQEVANALASKNTLNPDSGSIYNRLRDLFFAIDSGDPQLDLPPYNGHLFSDGEHPFLEKNMIGDAHLIPALDKLARVDVNGKRVFVDYRDLEVRHLGSIYEKLLEYELDIATQPLTVKEKQYQPAQAGDTVFKQPGQVYLRTGSNERKVTGSYYTPDYIVRFIVEKTLEPLLLEITARHATLDNQGVWQVQDGEGLIHDILALNVLDPATGSGHFIVDATSYIAEWLRSLGLRPVDVGDEDELIYWKRQVASACIYAVDINPLAVELAKLSMWLTTLAKGKPLSFLDHHIRVGNSLVGTSISTIDDTAVLVTEEEKRRKVLKSKQKHEAKTGQISMFSDADFNDGVRYALQQMREIESTIADNVIDVKHQEQLYADLTKRLNGWQQAADVWTARYFGLELSGDQWKLVRDATTSGMIPPSIQPTLQKAAQLAEQHKFFHWDLAFPEIFYDVDAKPKATPGFDAVGSNPPYVRQERIQPIKPFLQAHYSVYSGTADLFLYFYELGLEFVKPGHRIGYITSGTYMSSNSAKPFRQYIAEQAAPEWAVNFGENQPFKGAEMVYPTMIVLKREKPTLTFKSLFVEKVYKWHQLGEALKLPMIDADSSVLKLDEWRFQAIELTDLFKKVMGNKSPLAEYVSNNIYYGIKTSFNEAFIVDSATKERLINEHESSKEILVPLVRGEDLRPWYQIESGLYLVKTHQGIDIDRYPAVKAHLAMYQDGLSKRWEAARGEIQWYELRPCDYYDEFAKVKILVPDIAKLPRFSLDKSGIYCNDKGFFIVLTSLSTLAVLNSRVAWFALSQIATPLRLRANLWQYQAKLQFAKRLPIPILTPTQESDLASLAEEITGLSQQRYQAHEQMRHRISTDLGGEQSLNNALWDWWDLPNGAALRAEVKKAFKRDIPLSERSDWERYLADQQIVHQHLTQQIIDLEIRLNDIVYDAFDLTPEERQLIEAATKYPYGEV